MKKLFYITALAPLLVCCKKKEMTISHESEVFITDESTYDTIKSSTYLAAYPGSYWEFDNGVTYECYDYRKFPFISNSYTLNGSRFVHIDTVYVPKHSRFGLIYYEGMVSNTSNLNKKTLAVGLVDSNPGVGEYYNPGGSGNVRISYNVEEMFDSLLVGGEYFYNVAKVREKKTTYWDDLNIHEEMTWYYFAQEVGLIRWDLQWLITPYEDTIQLVDYYIAPH